MVRLRSDRARRNHHRRRPHLGESAIAGAAPSDRLHPLPLALRFDGRQAVIASRAIDESGYIQPTREALIAARGTNSAYHFNGIKFWKVQSDGTVTNVET